MSDALSKFIGGLQSLDPQAAFANFKSLDAGTQGQVLENLAGRYGSSFDELNNLSAADKQRVTDNVKAGRDAFTGVTRQQAQDERPLTFEQAWASQAEATRNAPSGHDAAYTQSHDDFAQRHGAEAARSRHGYQNPAREAQLARQAAIRAEADRAGVSFGDMADRFVNEGR